MIRPAPLKILAFSLLLAAFGLSACTPTVANRGQIVDADKLAEVQAGTTTREEVVRLLGSPTQVGTFDEKVWYYFGRSTKQYSFFDPEIVEQQAIEVRFNDEGVVASVNKLDPAEAQAIDPVSRRTPTYGHETTVIEQLLGNIGKPKGNAGKSGR